MAPTEYCKTKRYVPACYSYRKDSAFPRSANCDRQQCAVDALCEREAHAALSTNIDTISELELLVASVGHA